jgi:hypothetical protein
VFCKNCGASITGETASGDPAQHNPCPHCGSLDRNRTLYVPVGEYAIVGDSADPVLITYPEALLDTARDLIAKDKFGVAVVVAHMACEIGAERVLSRAFTTKGIEYLQKPMEEFFSSYSLANERVRKLYNAVTGDQIQTQPFWSAFTKLAKQRNQAVHGGWIATKAEAETSLRAASDFVAYLKEKGSDQP